MPQKVLVELTEMDIIVLRLALRYACIWVEIKKEKDYLETYRKFSNLLEKLEHNEKVK